VKRDWSDTKIKTKFQHFEGGRLLRASGAGFVLHSFLH